MSESFKIEKTGDWSSQDILFSMERLPETEQLFVGSSDFQVYSFDASQNKPERIAFSGEGHQSYVTGMVRVENTLITGSYDGHLVWWDLLERTSLKKIPAHDRWIRRVIVSPDQNRVITVADDMQCKVWDSRTGELIKSFSDHAALTPHHYPSMLYAVAVSDDGKLIATGDRVGHVAIWDTETFEKVGELEPRVDSDVSSKLEVSCELCRLFSAANMLQSEGVNCLRQAFRDTNLQNLIVRWSTLDQQAREEIVEILSLNR